MKNPRISDEEVSLIKSAQEGSEPAFSKLYKNYEKYVLKTIMQYIRDFDDAKALVIDTFVDAYTNLSTFKDYKSFAGWLRTIAYRNVVDYIRSKDSHIVGSIDDDDRLSSFTNISDDEKLDIVDRVTINQIKDNFKQLSEDHQRICELYYVNELTMQEISEKLKIPKGTVKSVLSRVSKRLVKKLKN